MPTPLFALAALGLALKTVTVRLATLNDVAAVRADIADHSGTGSGTGDDEYLISQFGVYLSKPESYTVLIAEEQGKAVGTMSIAWASSGHESYFEGLRVASAARQKGVAALLFEHAARLAVATQGPNSVGRWGLVNSNSVMVDWSQRLELQGPLLFRRHAAQAAVSSLGAPPPLPDGFSSLRPMREDASEVEEVMNTLPSFRVWRSAHGSQNFVRAGWAEFSEAELADGCARKPLDGVTPPAPLLLRDEVGRLVGICSLGKITVPEDGAMVTYLLQKYVDGASSVAIGCMLDALPYVARDEECAAVGGYVPSVDWMVALFEQRSAVWARATATEQAVYAWQNAQVVAGAALQKE